MIGSGRETMSGLAAGLSATEDRELMARLNVGVQFESSPMFETTAVGGLAPANSGPMLDSMHNFEEGLLGFDDALDPSEDGIDETYLSKDDPILLAVQEAGGTPWPTPWTEPHDWGFSSAHGWDGGKLGGPEPGRLEGIYLEAIQGLEVAPTLAGKNARKDQFKTVVVAAFQPGTPFNREVVKKLLDKSVRLADLAEKRALVTKRARDAFESNLRRVDANDREVSRLYGQVFDASGKIKQGASDATLRKLLELRKKNIELGRDTVRLQKLNMLAAAITSNTLTQLTTIQNMAQAVATGTPQAVPALGLAYDKLGRENAKVRTQRAKQQENWAGTKKVKAARDVAGLEGFDGLYGLDVIERPFDNMEHDLAALEFSFKRIRRAAKKVGRTVKKASKTVGNVAKEVGKATNTLVNAAVIAPTKGTLEAAKRIAKGDVKGAFKAVGQSVVAQAKGLKDFAAQTVLKWGCDVANTKAFKAGVQAVGQSVGTVVGGVYTQPQLGGAIGTEAGGQVANLQRNTCGAMKTVGLTDGKFKPGRIDNAAKDFAKRAWKETLSPKAQLASLKNIATSAVGGQFASSFNVGGVDVMKKVGLDPNKLVSNNPAIQNLYKQGTSKLQGKLQSQFQKTTGGLLKKTGIPGAQRLVSVIQRGGQMPTIKSLTEQGANLARREVANIGRRAVGAAVTRVVRANAAPAQNLIRGNVSAAALARMAQQIAPATVNRAPLLSNTISRYLSQPTDAALPYVGSIGRDF